MALFSEIAVRSNTATNRIDKDWFNALRAAGITLESFIGEGAIPITTSTIANSQASATNVTGLVVDKANYKSARVFCEVRRKTATSEVVANGWIVMLYRENTDAWEVIPQPFDGDDVGVTFSITSSGQVQYTTDTLSGSSYSGSIKFRGFTF